MRASIAVQQMGWTGFGIAVDRRASRVAGTNEDLRGLRRVPRRLKRGATTAHVPVRARCTWSFAGDGRLVIAYSDAGIQC